MNIASLGFLVLCGLGAVLFHRVPGTRLRRAALSVINLAFLATFVPNFWSGVGFVTFILATYAVLRFIQARPSGWWVGLAVAGTLAAFLVLKKYAFLEAVLPASLWNHPVALIGLSYMLFKFIHVLVDEWQGQLLPCTFAGYANYQLAFFTLLAGPIQRYNDFQQSWETMDCGPGDTRQTLLAWNRILTGLIKMNILGAAAAYAFDQSGAYWGAQPTSKLLLRFAVYFYSYPVYLYFNFSGYTDIAIGSARLFGWDLPENFNQPYYSRNVIDYWNRWHITLSHWIRDYVFMTSYKFAAERLPRWNRPLSYGLLFVSLFLAGVWHGSTLNFAVFGAINGLGAAVNQLYGDGLKGMLGRAGFQRYQKSRPIRWAAIGLTFNFICFSMLFFGSDTRQACEILTAVGSRLLHH